MYWVIIKTQYKNQQKKLIKKNYIKNRQKRENSDNKFN